LKKGEEFEIMIASLERILSNDKFVRVEHNVKLKTKKGNFRTVDVLIEQTINRFTYKTIIECRDKKTKIKATDVNAFKSLMDNVDAHQGIIVSKSGFQKGAIIEAANERILLHTLNNIDVTTEFLRTTLICQYQYKIEHIETIMNFKEKKIY
jgi:hypothetical protein